MEWLLVVLTATQGYSSSFNAGSHKSEAACATAAPAIVAKMTAWERKTRDALATATPVPVSYTARQWDWVCAPAGKK